MTALRVVLVCLAACSSCLAADAADNFLRNAYTAQRSSDIFVVDAQQAPPQGASVFLADSSLGLTGSMSDVSFSDFAAHRLGIEVKESSELSSMGGSLHSDDIFRKSRAMALFVLDGLPLEELPRDLGLHSIMSAMPVRENSAFQDEVALLTSMVSGAPVSQHGIPGRTWFRADGTRVSAFSSPWSQSKASNLADRLQRATHGNSLVLSASSNQQLAAAMATHPLVKQDHPYWKSYGVYLDSKSKSFASVYHENAHFEPAFLVEQSDIVNFGNLMGHPELLRVSREGARLTIAVGGASAEFTVDHPLDYAFLAEMEFMLDVVSALQREPELRSLVRDYDPDYFAFGVASVRRFRSYGEHSDKFLTALRTADAVICHAVQQMRAMYGQNFLFQGLLLDQRKVEVATHSLVNSIAKQLEQDVVIYGTSIFPNSKAWDVCVKLNAKLTGARLYCPVDLATAVPLQAQLQQHHQRQLPVPDVQDNGYHPPEPYLAWSSVIAFHLVFWTSIVIGLSLLLASTAIGSLSIPSNSPLVRQLPNIYQSTSVLREL